MLDIIWGYKTVAVFDVWSVEHFLSGISVGTLVLINNHKSLGEFFLSLKGKLDGRTINFLKYKYDLIFLLFLAYIWETFEHYLEAGMAGAKAEYWFQGVEFWPNRLLADPAMLVLGYLSAKHWPRTIWPARILSLVWLIVHIFIFPHCMYLQKWF
jgi:hypothetical protein